MSSNDNPKSALKRTIAALLPKRLIEERGIFLRLRDAGQTYAKLQLLDTMGIRQSSRHSVPASARSFLFVCHGNIMRSPMAELMFKRAFSEYHHEEITVLSAGIHATPGTEAHPQARVAARHFGLSLDQHRSKLLTKEMVANANVVFAMDLQNLAELRTRFPQARNKILLLGVYAEGAQRGRPIADPYFGDHDQTSRCYAVLETCVRNLANMWSSTSRASSHE